jgi:hypothetical protein
MLEQTAMQVRVAVEKDGVIANCWLPGPALHNLAAGMELAVASHSFPADTIEPAGPQTLNELLALPRSLTVTNSPDLRLLLEGLESQVANDHPEMPFQFGIVISGEDLREEGITQNQRPGDLDLRDRPLADILTEIMVRANPDKDAAGPNDPRCKLVWAIANDPESGDGPVVLVTTRKAAADRGLELPPAFTVE